MSALPFNDDLKLFAYMREHLYAAVLCDALDQAGYRQQAMRADIRPIYPDAVVVGRAVTMQSVDVYQPEENAYEHEIAAVDSLKPGDVMVASTQQSTRTCVWGELLSTASMVRGANGAIIDGYTRDVRLIQQMGFPLFSTGIYPVDSAGRGQVIDYNCTVNCGDVVVSPGDVIFGDSDGVVVIPKDALRAVVEQAVAKVEGENITREELRKGLTLRDVFNKYGVL
ncbi:MAG: RraA family protein [Caldilineaceae bacterium]|nr:RraA family protein [Caldilineaceae bacterium]